VLQLRWDQGGSANIQMEEHSKVNVLVAIDVVKEYIDVRNCSCVIRFDLPKTVRSFIQSRGRVR